MVPLVVSTSTGPLNPIHNPPPNPFTHTKLHVDEGGDDLNADGSGDGLDNCNGQAEYDAANRYDRCAHNEPLRVLLTLFATTAALLFTTRTSSGWL